MNIIFGTIIWRACDAQEIKKFYWLQVSTFLCPKYIEFWFENLENGWEDESGHTLKEMLGIYQPYEYSWMLLSNSTKYIWQLIKNIAAIVIHMFGIHIQAKLIQANLGFG